MRILLASIYPFVFLLLFVTIPFDNYMRALPNIVLAILAVLFPFVVQKEHFKKIKKIPALLLMALVLFVAANAYMNGRMETDWMVINKIGLAVGLALLYIPIQGFEKINKAIIFSSLAAIFFSLGKLVIVINGTEDFSFLDSATIIEAVLIDRLYLGLLCVLSILVSYKSIQTTYHPDNRYYVTNIVVNVLFVLLIISRISIIVLTLVFLISLLYKKKRLPQLFFVTAGFLLMVILTLILNNDLRKKVFYSDRSKSEGLVANTLAKEPRTIVWDCAYELSQEDNMIWSGLGFTGTNNKLVDCYKSTITDTTKRDWFLFHRYNTHNQFIDFYLATGIFGFLIFTAGILILFIRNRKHYFPSVLLVTLVCFAMVENLFHRQIGAYYVGFILIALLISEKASEKQLTNES